MVSYAWGGLRNGQIPTSELQYTSGGWLRADAAQAFNAMAQAFSQAFAKTLTMSEGYRDYDTQVEMKAYWTRQGKPGNAASPGSSIHGWALAVDIDLNGVSSAEINWLHTEGRQFGFNWESTGRPTGEPWHLDFNLPVTVNLNDYILLEDDSMSAADVADLKSYIDKKGHGLRLIQATPRGIGVVGAGYFKGLTPEELPIAVELWGWPENYGDNARAFDLAVAISLNGVSATDDSISAVIAKVTENEKVNAATLAKLAELNAAIK